jgi:hypothetical protein
MAIPAGWQAVFQTNPNTSHSVSSISDVRAVCPYCRNAVTFTIETQNYVRRDAQLTEARIVVRCNYATCRRTTFIYLELLQQRMPTSWIPNGNFFMYPSKEVDIPHPAVPASVAEDYREAQKCLADSSTKAAAVMFRRVLYSVLIDKGCKLHPIREGVEQLINQQRLPAIFDDWLPAIRDDGHDGAHPDRALQVSAENITETAEYTAELLRFLYIEPYEFLQRKNRNSPSNPA